MNDAAAIDEAHRDWLEVRRYPRGNRLTIQPMNASNIGRDEPTDEVPDDATIKETK